MLLLPTGKKVALAAIAAIVAVAATKSAAIFNAQAL